MEQVDQDGSQYQWRWQTPIMCDKVVVTNEPLHDSKLKEWDCTHKYEEKRWNKCQEDKKSLITIICGQLDDGTKNELEVSMVFSVKFMRR